MMALLSQEELGAQKAILSHWQSPGEFVRSAYELMSKVGSVQFFTDTDAAFGRDGWVASKLSSVSTADAVRGFYSSLRLQKRTSQAGIAAMNTRPKLGLLNGRWTGGRLGCTRSRST